MNLGLIGYAGAAAAYCIFALLLVISWRGALKGGLLAAVIATSAVWAGMAAIVANSDRMFVGYQVFEVLRYGGWFLFLFSLFTSTGKDLPSLHPYLGKGRIWAGIYVVATILVLLFNWGDVYGTYILLLLLPIIGLVLIEQLIRNIDEEKRWASKFLFLGIGGIFVYDFFLYSHSLMFNGLDRELWDARGIVNILAVPLIAISVARNREWSLELYVSRDVVLHSTTIFGGGLYLILMSLVGYYLEHIGGEWGRLLQAVFLSLSLFFLVVIVFSAQIRAKFRVFLGKHFYKNRYDYRFEWLRLTQSLTKNEGESGGFGAIVQAMAQIVTCRCGALWLVEHGGVRNVAVWKHDPSDDIEPIDSAFISLLRERDYIINLKEPEGAQKGILPAWVAQLRLPWLIVPLRTQAKFLGFVVLGDPLVERDINWEDRDLLKVAANQVASYIEIDLASEALGQAKQFEAFNRLSAFMVHDLKNIAAELQLINKNADKFRHDEEFLNDVFETVAHSTSGLERLLEHLRGKRALSENKRQVDLRQLVMRVIAKSSDKKPIPEIDAHDEEPFTVQVEAQRLETVIKHLVDNAQEATPDTGYVRLKIFRQDQYIVLQIADNGSGMSKEFVRDRLFKPFDTTKGNAGMGIGMYESRDFIQGIGGKIDVASEPGEGTEISVYIPSLQ